MSLLIQDKCCSNNVNKAEIPVSLSAETMQTTESLVSAGTQQTSENVVKVQDGMKINHTKIHETVTQ